MFKELKKNKSTAWRSKIRPSKNIVEKGKFKQIILYRFRVMIQTSIKEEKNKKGGKSKMEQDKVTILVYCTPPNHALSLCEV